MHPNTIDRIAATMIAVTVAHITLGTSRVELNLWVLTNTFAELLALLYVSALAAVIARPDQPNPHIASAVAGSAFWLGRAGGFIDLVLAGGRWDLMSAVNERLLIVGLLILWHMRSVRAIAIRQNLHMI